MKIKIFIFFIITILIELLIIQCPTQSSGSGGTNKSQSTIKVSNIVSGEYHTIVLLDNGTVKCWGHNNYGQLGYEDTEDRGDEPGEMGDNLPYVSLW